MLTSREMSIGALADQVQSIKAHLDARIAEART